MTNYIAITNTDGTPYANWLWAVLPNYNRLGTDVTAFDLIVTGIPNRSEFGFIAPNIGEFTVFRKDKTTGLVDFVNVLVSDCMTVTSIVFYPTQLDPEPNFNFKLNITIAELAGNLLSAIEYGYSRNNIEVITNWQTSNVFNLVNEGNYYFDVRVIGSGVSVGKQLVELSLNASGTTITGGDETDNPIYGTSSGDEN